MLSPPTGPSDGSIDGTASDRAEGKESLATVTKDQAMAVGLRTSPASVSDHLAGIVKAET